MRPLIKIMFSFDNVMITLGTIGVSAALYFIPQNFDFLNPVGQALQDLDLTDMVFSKFTDETKTSVDTSIVIVNIGNEDRQGIARIVRNINKYSPKVVGIDAFFRMPKDEYGDSVLAESFRSTNNLILVSKVAFKTSDEREFDTLETSNPMFMKGVKTGYANLIVDQMRSFMTCRETTIQERYAGKVEPSFALAMADVFAPSKAALARKRHEGIESINFRGNESSFYHVDVDMALDSMADLSIVSNKVVILGFMGASLGAKSFEDNFFTPLNEQYVGRSFPDMYGCVVHANILAMILHENYIDHMPFWWSIVVGFFVLVANVMFFTYMYTRYESWYDVIAVSTQLFESLAMLFLIVFVFSNYDYKLALTPALFGVFLVGTVHDLYQDSVKKIILTSISRIQRRKRFASSRKPPRTAPPGATDLE